MGFLRQRVRHDHQAMRAAAGGGFIVVLRNQFRDGLGEFVAESRPVRRRAEANLGIHRQGREAFARLFRTANKAAHLPLPPGARSLAERKRTSVSTARVARRLPVSFARRTRSPTSRTTRAPRAMR